MKTLRPFFLLIQRPLTLFGAIGWMIIATFLISALVKPGGDPDTFMDAAFLTVIVLSVYSGWVLGACVLELQQASFSFTLPGARRSLVPGFLIMGAISAGFAVAFVAAASPHPQSTVLLFVVGMGSYALGGAIRDPQSDFMTGLSVALFLVLVVTSGTLGQFATESPQFIVTGAIALLLMGIYRLFARMAFRTRAVDARSMVLAFSLKKLVRSDRYRRLSYGPRKSRWKPARLGQDTAGWVRAAWHETYGATTVRAFGRFLARSWGLFLLIVLAAREGSGEVGFFKAVCWSLHDAIMRSPYSPVFGEKGGPFLIVAIGIAVAGSAMAVFSPVRLSERMLYPLSRRQKCRVRFIGSLVDLTILLFLVAPVLYLLGHATGWVVGIESRFDYVPYFFRVLLVTLILMPFAYWLSLLIGSPAIRQVNPSVVGIVLGQAAFVLVALLLMFVVGQLSLYPWVEILVLFVCLVLSRMLYGVYLRSWYRTADLA